MTPEDEDMTQEQQDAATDAPTDAATSELEALRIEVSELKDRMLRAMADAENTRRRAEREKADASSYAISRFARDMLNVADNFARAIDALPAEAREAASPQVRAVIEGVEATDRQLLATLEQHGVKKIDTSDGKFDPNLHQAIAQVPGNGKPAGTIVDVVQVGYQIGERLLRPSMVTVARQDEGAAAPGPAGESGSTVDTKA
ncbi:MAG TPA: nucleotide exchange factor GrpE [Rhizomicrobium sp.]|nr:nucleotide exchange factor GrpE [Rhizomicrobium sp.]